MTTQASCRGRHGWIPKRLWRGRRQQPLRQRQLLRVVHMTIIAIAQLGGELKLTVVMASDCETILQV